MIRKTLSTAILVALAGPGLIATAQAETLRWARAGDSLTLDPHAQNEGPTHTLAHQVYEPLLQRTVDITTEGANPLMPNNLTNLFMMDSGWTVDNDSAEPQDVANGGDNYAARNTNGTGAYRLVSRVVDEKTVLQANDAYWGKGEFPLEVSEIVYTPIQSAATRVAALLSGEVDFIQDVPVQDLARVAQTDTLTVVKAPQNRTIFFGMNSGDDDLTSDNVDGKNPFADVRVREAMNMAIDRKAIQRVVMRDQSEPTGIIMPPFVNGWTEALDAYPEADPEKAKALLAEAGYPDGFSIVLNCPNDRYINDEAICQAAVGMFGRIGVTVNLDAKPKAQHFPLIKNKETDFYMLFSTSYCTRQLMSWVRGMVLATPIPTSTEKSLALPQKPISKRVMQPLQISGLKYKAKLCTFPFTTRS